MNILEAILEAKQGKFIRSDAMPTNQFLKFDREHIFYEYTIENGHGYRTDIIPSFTYAEVITNTWQTISFLGPLVD
jgi:hypothetical protein